MWEPGSEGAASWDLSSLARTGTLEGESCTLDFALSCQDRELTFKSGRDLQEHITWLYELTSRTKDLTPRSLQVLTAPIPYLLLLKGACWKLSVTLGFLEHEPPISLYESAVNLCLFQTLRFSIDRPHCVRHMALRFSNLLTCSQFPLPLPALNKPLVYFLSLDLSFLSVSYIVVSNIWGLSLGIMFLRSIHVITGMNSLLLPFKQCI